jgi:phage terminase large subunit-like protein
LENSEIDLLLSLPSSELEALLTQLPVGRQADIVCQMSQRLTELEEEAPAESSSTAITLEEARNDPAAFRRRLLVDKDGHSVPLGEMLDPWQRDDFEAMDNAWRRIAGKFQGECCARAYLERPKGHSKTTDLAAMALWALFASPRKIVGISAAAAKPQAKLMRDAIDTILRLNPWLWAEIRVNNYEVKNPLTGSVLTILASNERSSHGPNPDFVICDEVTHWADRDLWDSLYAAAGKRAS